MKYTLYMFEHYEAKGGAADRLTEFNTLRSAITFVESLYELYEVNNKAAQKFMLDNFGEEFKFWYADSLEFNIFNNYSKKIIAWGDNKQTHTLGDLSKWKKK